MIKSHKDNALLRGVNGQVTPPQRDFEEESLNDGFTLVSSHIWNSQIKLWKISCESWKSKITIPMRVLNGMGP